MMNHDIEEMIWTIAETGDENAIAEFERRYPEYRARLATRCAMVEVLRRSRPTDIPQRSFHHPVKSVSKRWNWLLAPAAALLLVGVGFGAYLIVDTFSEKQPDPPTIGGVDGVGSTEGTSQPEVTGPPPSSYDSPPDSMTGTEPRPPTGTQEPTEISITASGMTLFEVLNLIATDGGIQMQIMPGVEDMDLALATENPDAIMTLPAADLLLMLERVAPIRILDAGPDGILILPLDQVRNAPDGPGLAAPTEDTSDGN